MNILNEPLESNGSEVTAALNSDLACSWAGPITLNVADEHSFYPRQGDLTLSGVISGPGTLRVITQQAKVILAGPAANTYSGGTFVYSGELVLAKNPGVTAIPGALNIGENEFGTFATSVVLSNLNQIADSASSRWGRTVPST